MPAARSATRTLLPFAAIMFLGYAAVGLPLSTLPLLVNHGLGYGTAVVGIVIGGGARGDAADPAAGRAPRGHGAGRNSVCWWGW